MQMASARALSLAVARWGLALFVLAFSIFSIQPITSKLIVYQEEWGPALTLACLGRMGFLDFRNAPAEEAAAARTKYAAFINRQPVPAFSCRDLPAGTTINPMSDASNHSRFFLRYQVGLMAAVGTLWGIFGPNWAWLGFFSALLAAGTILALYAIARHFVGTIWAAVLAGIAGFHPAFTLMFPFTRDFGKAFFVITSFLVLLLLINLPQASRERYIAVCALLGAFLGIGLSFRQDALVIAALTGLLLVLFPPLGLDSERVSIVKTQIASLLAFAGAFLLFAVPLYRFVPVDHSHEGHFLILGLIDMTFKNAGFSPGAFLLNPSYEDYSGYTLTTAHSMAETGRQDIEVFSREYNEGGMRQFFETVLVFPFTLIGRIYAIFWDILTSRSLLAGGGVGKLIFGGISIAALTIAFMQNRRLAVFLVLYILATSAMLSLQYVDRHYFHVHFLWLVIAFAIVLSALTAYIEGKAHTISEISPRIVSKILGGAEKLNVGLALLRSQAWPNLLLGKGQPLAVNMRFPHLALAGIVLLPAVAFIAESITAKRWTEKVVSSNFTPAAVADPEQLAEPTKERVLVGLRADGERTFTNFAGLTETFENSFKRQYRNPTGGLLRVRFSNLPDCPGPVNLRVVYDAKHSFADMSHKARPDAALQAQQKDYFFPAFFVDESRFKGVEFDASHIKCFESMSWGTDFRDIRLPVEFWDGAARP